MWSRAYRSEAHVLTEAKFEEYHQKIVRHIYIEGFKRKQLDVLIKVSYLVLLFVAFSVRYSFLNKAKLSK